MSYPRLFFLLFVALQPAICHANNLCPWITKATAFGALGTNEDSSSANVSERGPTVCIFSYQAGSVIHELRITVEQDKDPEHAFNKRKAQCGQRGTPLRAIGNEAVMCSADKKIQVEQVFGRVRDNVFSISISTTAKNDPTMPRDTLIEKAELVAEQISGNLF